MPEDAVAEARGALAEAEAVFGPEHPYTTMLRTRLARALGEAGLPEQELPVRRRILADLTAREGAQDSDSAVAAHNYGFCLHECGRPQEAVGHIERAVRDIAPFVRQDGPALFRLRRNLAVVLQAAGRTAEAVALLEQILAEQERNTTVTADDLRGARIALAEDYRVQTGPAAERGRAEGERLWRTILHAQEQHADADDPEIMRLRNKFAVFYATTGRNREALPIYLRNLEERERVLGPDDPETMLSRSNLAICHEALGERESAVRILAPLYEQRARLLGADHEDTLDTLDRYALCLYNLGRHREAEEHFALLVEARTRIGGADDRTRANYLSWLGWSRYRAGRPGRALQALRACLADRERVLGAEHVETMTARHALGDVLQALRRHAEAIPVLERALADRERILGPGGHDTLKTRALLAKALAADGRHDESVLRRRADYEAVVQEHGAEDREAIVALTRVADAEEEAEQYPAALASYARALATAERILGPEHSDTVMCRFSVAAYHQCKGTPDEAIPLFEQVLANYRRRYGEEAARTLKIRRDIARCHDAAGRTDQALEEYRALLSDAKRVLPRSDKLRRSLAADLAEPPVASWWNREVLTGRRLWQVGLGTVLVAEAVDAGYTTDVLYKRRWLAPSDTVAALRKSWSIGSRDELLGTLARLASPENTNTDHFDDPDAAAGSSESTGPAASPVSAWNIARYVNNVRDGVVAGYLAEPEAWELLEQITEPTARAYDSWAGFTADYLAGRAKWLGLGGPPRPDWPTAHRRRIEAVDRLLDPLDRNSPFNRAPWDTVADAGGTPRPKPRPAAGPRTRSTAGSPARAKAHKTARTAEVH